MRGGRIHGKYPQLRTDGPTSISGTGQQLPTLPWEALWSPVAEWLGVDAGTDPYTYSSEMLRAFPNIAAFPKQTMLTMDEVFGA